MTSSMKQAIEKIQPALQTAEALSYIRDSDIYITDDLYQVPAGKKFPAVAIKDGPIKMEEKAGGMWMLTTTVLLAIFVQNYKATEAIMGNTDTGAKGILEFEADVIGVLSENKLDIEGIELALWGGSDESEKFEDETEAIQMKIIKFRYEKEEDRP